MDQNLILQPKETQPTLMKFIFQSTENKKILIIAAIGVLIQFIIFKSLYPYADFFSDSYSYIFAAAANLDISIWPIGYSKFLRAFHELTHSDTAVVAFQYFFLEVSSLYFFFSVLYLHKPGRFTRNILFLFLFFNPLFLYLSNYINSDPLFAAISILWIAELLWILHKPKPYHIFTQGVLLFLAFTVRNNAYYYPFVAAVAFLLSRQQFRLKLAGIIFPLLLIFPFVIHSRNEAYKITGIRQFSLFTGWQLANNALYMYGHIRVDSSRLPSPEARELDRLSKQFFSKLPPDGFTKYLSNYVANFFIRQPSAPLKKYFEAHSTGEDGYGLVEDWGRASVVFGEYGEWLIKHYPVEYARYFMLLNTKNYFFPPLEKLEIYNLGQDDVSTIAQDWFDYPTPNVTAVSKEVQGNILFIFPCLFLFLNALYIGSQIWLFTKRRTISMSPENRAANILIAVFSLANFGFCVFATIIVLRYQFFPMVITLTFSLLLFEWLDKKEIQSSKPIEEARKKTINLGLAEL